MLDGAFAEQLSHRFARGLAFDIPECHIDAADAVAGDAAGAVPRRSVNHRLQRGFGVERVHAADDFRQAVAEGGRTRSFDDGARDIGAGDDFAKADEAGIGVDADDEHVLGAVGDLFDFGQTQVQRFDLADLQGVFPMADRAFCGCG